MQVENSSKAVGVAMEYCAALVTKPDSKKVGTLVTENVSYGLIVNDRPPFCVEGKKDLLEAFEKHYYKADSHIAVQNLSFHSYELDGKQFVQVELKMTKTHEAEEVNWTDRMQITLEKVNDVFLISEIMAKAISKPIEKEEEQLPEPTVCLRPLSPKEAKERAAQFEKMMEEMNK